MRTPSERVNRLTFWVTDRGKKQPCTAVASVSFIFVSPEVKILVVAATAARLRMTARPPASVLYRFMGLTSRSGKRPFEFSDDVACA